MIRSNYCIWAFCDNCGEEFFGFVYQRVGETTKNIKFCPSCGMPFAFNPDELIFDVPHYPLERMKAFLDPDMKCAVCDSALLFMGRKNIAHLHLDLQKKQHLLQTGSPMPVLFRGIATG